MEHEITIVDRGRGPQLSTSRITVQDLLPYFQLGYPHEQIIREAMPSLSVAEIEIAKKYFDEHREEVLEVQRQIRQRNATRKNSPEAEEIVRQGRLKVLARLAVIHNRPAEIAHGEGHPG
jgi:uncharacterized protein (DUF433 family)